MLVTQQPVLRRFWYPVIPLAELGDGPKPFTLLGEKIVLWKNTAGEPVALADRCCHRHAALSRGWIDGDRIVCGYHGWAYDAQGTCVKIPQLPDRPARGRVEAYRCRAAYDYAWVCLSEEPLDDIPHFEEAERAGYRLIQEFYEPWHCAGLRLMENSFDNAHLSFVHRNTFGQFDDPIPAPIEIDEYDSGFLMRAVAPVNNPEAQQKALNIAEGETERRMRSRWYLPFGRKLQITYPNGVVHAIVTWATPIDDANSMVCQFVFRSDSEAESPAAGIIAFDREVTGEDKFILESTNFDVPLDTASGEELHMPSDKPGMVMRKQLRRLLEAHGETEARLAERISA